MTDAPLLSVKDLTISFRVGRGEVTAVESVSFEVMPRETLAIVGESGSGKTTTAAAVNRLLASNGRIASGSMRFLDRDLVAATEAEMVRLRGAGIGLVPQDPMSNLNPLIKIGTQIGETLEAHGRTSGRETTRRVLELLEMVGIPDATRRASQYPHEFSGGMRQRALIAIGLACEPTLLIADEPTSALDVTVQRRVLNQLEELTSRMGTAVLLITHDLALAAERADRVAVMHRGRIVEHGEARRILRAPEHEYTQRLVAAAPSIAAQRSVGVAPRHEVPAVVEATPALVEVEDLGKVYPLRRAGGFAAGTHRAVDGVSLRIGRGQTVAIVGESGSGKSTTAKMILGLERPTSGAIIFDGVPVTRHSRRAMLPLRRRIQPVFQNPYASLDPRYTIERAIVEPLEVHRIGDRRSRRRRAADLLEKVALPQTALDRMPHELSGGQCQRVAIARALALDPDLVVLDEAVSALDVIVQAQILTLLSDLQRDLGLSYLFISHDLAVVKMQSHWVHVMREGRIVESGAAQDIFDRPQDPYTIELLAAIPAG